MTIQEFSFIDKKKLDNCMNRFCYYHENGSFGSRIYDGYNFPVDVIYNFTQLTKSEIWLKKQIKHGVRYIIGYMLKDEEVKIHELRHAKFYTTSSIQNEIKQVWELLPKDARTQIETQFCRLGYNKNVWIDEFYAYSQDKTFWPKKIYRIIFETYTSYKRKNEFKTKTTIYYII